MKRIFLFIIAAAMSTVTFAQTKTLEQRVKDLETAVAGLQSKVNEVTQENVKFKKQLNFQEPIHKAEIGGGKIYTQIG